MSSSKGPGPAPTPAVYPGQTHTPQPRFFRAWILKMTPRMIHTPHRLVKLK
jgi:hypothetical protein